MFFGAITYRIPSVCCKGCGCGTTSHFDFLVTCHFWLSKNCTWFNSPPPPTPHDPRCLAMLPPTLLFGHRKSGWLGEEIVSFQVTLCPTILSGRTIVFQTPLLHCICIFTLPHAAGDGRLLIYMPLLTCTSASRRGVNAACSILYIMHVLLPARFERNRRSHFVDSCRVKESAKALYNHA